MSSEASATRPITLRYEARSEILSTASGPALSLALSGGRGEVGVRGVVQDAGLLRDALATVAAIHGSDQRYKGKDRAAYLAYLAKKGKKATAAIWEAQKAFLDEALADDRKPDTLLDPALTVDPDEVSLEAFSKDESGYVRLSLSKELFSERQAAHGTTFVDLSGALVENLDRLRTHAPLQLSAAVSAPAAPAAPQERALQVPYAWLRGFLQVQSAATLPAVSCALAPIDLYNLLFALRTRKAKKSPRALRFELVPGAPPRLVLEPWELVLECHGPPHQGPSRVVRTFGRQRLLQLSRLLPHLRGARAVLLGPGLPVFWVLDLGLATLTLGLSSWTERGWGSAASFDALMPETGAGGVELLAKRVREQLLAHGPQPLPALQAAVNQPLESLRAALKLLCLRGQVLYDLARERYRPRDLLAAPVDEARIRFGNPAEGRAHRLLGSGPLDGDQQGDVRLTKVHEIAGEGVELQGLVTDREARRSFLPRFVLDQEGRAREASCGCPLIRRAGLREGPCEHLLALRLLYGRRRAKDEALRQTPEGRRLIRAETRTLVRRDESGAELLYRVSLDDKLVRLHWGAREAFLHSGPSAPPGPGEKAGRAAAGAPRQQRLWFDSDREAREAYFQRLEKLANEGFIDAEASV